MKIMSIKISKYHLILFLLVLLHGITNWIILKQDNVPFCYDEGGIYEMSRIYYYHLIENFTWNPQKNFYHYWATTHFTPPLYMLSHLPLFFLFGESQDVAVMTNMIFLAILIFSVYGIGKKIKDEKVGLFASIIISTFPAIFGFSRTSFAVIALTSLVALSIYLLLKTENFTNRKYVILFGISMGLGILTKLTYPIYIAASFVIYVLANVKRMTKRQIGNLFLSLGIGLFISSTWLAPNLITGSFFREARRLMGFVWERPYIRQIDWSFYLRSFQIQLHGFFAGLSVISILIFIFLRIKKEFKYLFLSWFIIPLLPLLIYRWKEVRYTIPLLPVLALIISFTIYNIKPQRIRNLIYCCVTIFGLLQIFLLSFNVNLKDQFTQEEYDERRKIGLLSAYKVDWPVEKIINLFSDYNLVYKENGKPARIIVIARGPLISYLSYRIRLPAKLGRIDDMPLNFIPCLLHPYSGLKEKIDNADYVLIEKQNSEYIPEYLVDYVKFLRKEFNKYKNNYNLLTTIHGEKQDKEFEVYINKKIAKNIEQKKREL